MRRALSAPRSRRVLLTAAITVTGLVIVPVQTQASSLAAKPPAPAKQPVATGYGGAVSTVDPDASATAIEVLRRGGNAVDAAVAASATLGVTEPFVAALGGGGFFTYYDARTRKVHTIDGRETAPAAMNEKSFVDPETGKVMPFAEAVTSGLSVGVPGTVAQWDQALDRWGTMRLRSLLKPAIRVADRGFTVDQEFYDQTSVNADRFKDFTSTRDLFLPGGKPPEVGSRFRNPDLAKTYRALGKRGPRWFYRGPVGKDVADTVRKPPVVPGTTRKVRPGLMKSSDLAAYRSVYRKPVKSTYKGLDVYGMAPPSSGGSTVGEVLNILENLKPKDRTEALHNYLEASRLAYADRGKYVGDGADVRELVSKGFARERSCLIKAQAATSPVPPGAPDGDYENCKPASGKAQSLRHEGPETTHLTVADKWGNVVAYTITIEMFGGSGITVPGRGFLLNNELTDFTIDPVAGDPNLPGPGKRPRSSMSPTIVLKNGKPLLALGSPGGSTIITSVIQVLLNRLDFGMDLPAAVAAPRATQRNTPVTLAEQGFIDSYGSALAQRGHKIELFPGPPKGQIGAVEALEFLGRGLVQAVAEPERRHGGSALVVRPVR